MLVLILHLVQQPLDNITRSKIQNQMLYLYKKKKKKEKKKWLAIFLTVCNGEPRSVSLCFLLFW